MNGAHHRTPRWTWTVCVLLLLATMLNYMDRLTLNQTSGRIIEEYKLSKEQYGQIESAFAIAFATGAIVVGFLVDRWNVWWVYPTIVFLWSLAGFATGFAQTYSGLLTCRFLLGLAEAGHWPCALRTTQRILAPAQRTLGNSILQSGAAIGAILTPLIVVALVSWTGTWRYPFLVVGSFGIIWVALWLVVVRRDDLALPSHTAASPSQTTASHSQTQTLASILLDRRLWVLIVVVVSINITWHYFRVWLPLFLQETHDYSETQANYFTSLYYLSTDAGSLSAGFATLWLARRVSVHMSRLLVFTVCALLTTLSVVAANLETSLLLPIVLLIIGFGALGLYPPYYSFTQDLTVRHQGKITGMLGCINWLAMAPLHWGVGRLIDQTKSYSLALSLVGLVPLVGVMALVLFWGKERRAD